MIGSQLKLMAALAGVVVLVVGVSGLVAQRGLHERELDRTTRALEARAALVRELIRGFDLRSADPSELDGIADRAGKAARARVTLVTPDGVVVGDSDVAADRLEFVANHGDRPEIREALAGREGRATRQSETVGRRLLYLAVPIDGGAGGVIRLAIELSDLDAASADLRRLLLISAGLGLVVAAVLSIVFARLTVRSLREVERLTTAIADGELDYRAPRRFSDELGRISDGIHRIADRLRLQLDNATAEREQLLAVLDSMVEGVLVIDNDMRVLLVNRRLAEILGIDGDVRGLTTLQLARQEPLHAVLTEAMASDEPISRTIEEPRLASRTFQIQAVRFPAGPSPRVGTVAVLHDITEVAQLDRVRREFVANASHELRTPLTAIQGFAETLLHGDELPNETVRSYAAIIERHSQRLARLVADLLLLSETEGSQTTNEPSSVDVSAMLRRIAKDSSVRMASKSIEFEAEGEAGAVAWVDLHATEQVIRNLLDNAIQYTEPGGRVTGRVGSDDTHVWVEIADTGIGIPEKDLGRIFERFYRVDKARSREAGGTGLGLSIVKHLVQNLGGEISVDSELGRGTTFRLTLPKRSAIG